MTLLGKFLKIKGWIDIPPFYPTIPEDVQEKLDSSEAFNLWDLLTYRYNNIELTEMYYNVINDGEFKTLVKVGIQGTLKKQAQMLEKELQYFGIPIPEPPPKTTCSIGNSDIIRDE